MRVARFDTGLGCLRVAGADRKEFLQRMTTNDVAGLAPGEGCLTLLLERNGRLVDRLQLLERGEDCLLLGPAERAPAARDWIDRYVFADDVSVEDLGAVTRIVTLSGPEADAVLAEAGLPADLAPFAHAEAETPGGPVTVARAEDVGGRAYHVIRAADAPDPLEAVPVGAPAEWELRRIEAGVPRLGAEWDESTIPLEAGMIGEIDFHKGCYLGQEIIARVYHHGRIKRLLARLELEAARPPAPGAELVAEGVAVGRITSAAGAGSRVLALAKVETGREAPGTRLALEDGTPARVLANHPEDA